MKLKLWSRWAAGTALACSQAIAADGAALYQAQCAACHGPAAAGNAALQAPPLAGFDDAYVQRQLQAFRAGQRGGDDAAPPAKAMRAVAQGLKGDDDIATIARHVAKLRVAATRPEASPAAQLTLGKQLFGVCMACHGGAAEGNTTLGAPRLAHLPAWYVAAQLAAYRAGTRGAAADDRPGQQMRQVANEALGSAEEAEAVARYITTLAGRGR